ncbi:MAG: hypothetical protein ACRCY8_14690 [Dermatophilaceae bacterium]
MSRIRRSVVVAGAIALAGLAVPTTASAAPIGADDGVGALSCSTSVETSGSVASASAECDGSIVEVYVSSTVNGVTVEDSETGEGSASASVDGGSGQNCSTVARITVDGVVVGNSGSSSSSC